MRLIQLIILGFVCVPSWVNAQENTLIDTSSAAAVDTIYTSDIVLDSGERFFQEVVLAETPRKKLVIKLPVLNNTEAELHFSMKTSIGFAVPMWHKGPLLPGERTHVYVVMTPPMKPIFRLYTSIYLYKKDPYATGQTQMRSEDYQDPYLSGSVRVICAPMEQDK